MPAGRPRQFDPEDVLDRAVDLIWKDGPFSHSLNEMAAELRLTKPALARMFGGKDDFLAKSLERYYDRVFVPLQVELAAAETPMDVARSYLGYYSNALGHKPVGPHTGCLLAATTEATAGTEGTVPEMTQKLNARMRGLLEETLERVGSEAPNEVAMFLYGQGIALAFLSRAGATGEVLGAFRDKALKALSA
ncbi:MAG: hypothetical protein AAF636_10885 [Pseudomonadota bacterium]